MQRLLSILLIFIPALIFGQEPDSTTEKTVDSLLQVSSALTGTGDFEKALEINATAEKLALEKWGRTSVGYARACYNRGRIMTYKGVYTEAEIWYLEAINIQESVVGKAHPDYATSLNSLANLYVNAGNYETAEPLFLEARAIWEKALGKDNAYTGWNAECLGSLYQGINNYEKAELYYNEANRIRGKILGKQHPDYASTLCSQASLYMQMRQYDKAEAYYLEAKAIQEKALGRENPDYAHTLDGLAVLYDDYLKDYKKAEALYLEVKAIREKTLGKTHPDYGWSLGNLGNFYWYTGKYDKAEPLFLEANALWEKTLGKTHPNYIWSLHKLWALYWSMGNQAKAESYWFEMNQTEKKQFLQAAHYLSTDELSAYTRKFQDGLNEGFSFARTQTNIVGPCYDNLLFYKGFLLNAISRVRSLALVDTVSAAKFNALKSIERRLGAEYAKLPAEQKNVAELQEKQLTLEKDLIRGVAGFGEAMRQVSWQEVQQKLQPGEAAIEFVHYKSVDPRPTDSTVQTTPYAALLLRPGAEQPLFIPLFEETQLQTLLQQQGKSKAGFINALYSSGHDTMLYKLLWQPLETQLTGISTIYFSPSGLLYYVNLAAIPVPTQHPGQLTEETLADRFHLIEMGSTRQLVVPTAIMSDGSAPVLYGGIQYDIDSSALIPSNTNPDLNRGGDWSYLKWTEVEMSATGALLSDAGLRPVMLKGAAATEESFKAMGIHKPSPRIVHLATHGFFFPEPKTSSSGQQVLAAGEKVFKTSDNPMMRSGLVLAGGNYAWKHGKPFRPDLEDGILTAYEISQMNLQNTELVVLSACETGLGDIQGNEGVYGLQRAFKIAGVKYLIMSLWQIPDFQTQELMTTFYSRWLEDNMTIPGAFASAQKTMREKYKDPFLWAGFVLVE